MKTITMEKYIDKINNEYNIKVSKDQLLHLIYMGLNTNPETLKDGKTGEYIFDEKLVEKINSYIGIDVNIGDDNNSSSGSTDTTRTEFNKLVENKYFKIKTKKVTNYNEEIKALLIELNEVRDSVKNYAKDDDKFGFSKANQAILNNINNWYNKISNSNKYIAYTVKMHKQVQEDLANKDIVEDINYLKKLIAYQNKVADKIANTQETPSGNSPKSMGASLKGLIGNVASIVKGPLTSIVNRLIELGITPERVEKEGINFNSDGNAMLGDKLLINCDSALGKPGEVITITQSDGSELKCLIINTDKEKYKDKIVAYNKDEQMQETDIKGKKVTNHGTLADYAKEEAEKTNQEQKTTNDQNDDSKTPTDSGDSENPTGEENKTENSTNTVESGNPSSANYPASDSSGATDDVGSSPSSSTPASPSTDESEADTTTSEETTSEQEETEKNQNENAENTTETEIENVDKISTNKPEDDYLAEYDEFFEEQDSNIEEDTDLIDENPDIEHENPLEEETQEIIEEEIPETPKESKKEKNSGINNINPLIAGLGLAGVVGGGAKLVADGIQKKKAEKEEQEENNQSASFSDINNRYISSNEPINDTYTSNNVAEENSSNFYSIYDDQSQFDSRYVKLNDSENEQNW